MSRQLECSFGTWKRQHELEFQLLKYHGVSRKIWNQIRLNARCMKSRKRPESRQAGRHGIMHGCDVGYCKWLRVQKVLYARMIRDKNGRKLWQIFQTANSHARLQCNYVRHRNWNRRHWSQKRYVLPYKTQFLIIEILALNFSFILLCALIVYLFHVMESIISTDLVITSGQPC